MKDYLKECDKWEGWGGRIGENGAKNSRANL